MIPGCPERGEEEEGREEEDLGGADQHHPGRKGKSGYRHTGMKSSCHNAKCVETNQSNFRIYPTDIHLLPPHGTTLMAYADVCTDVGRC